MNIETKVYEVIFERIDGSKNLDPNSPEYKANVDVALKFIDRAAEIEKIHVSEEANRLKLQQMEDERKDRLEKIRLEEEANKLKLQQIEDERKDRLEKIRLEEEANKLKLQQMEDERKDRFVRNILTGLSIAIPPTVALVAAFGFSVLERTEMVASTPAREFMKRALRLS